MTYKPLTFDDWDKRFAKMREDGQEKLDVAGCRDFVATLLTYAGPAIWWLLYEDPDVKNYWALKFASDDDTKGYTVCFRRDDGHYPSDKPLLEMWQAMRIERLETEVRGLRAALQEIADWKPGYYDNRDNQEAERLQEMASEALEGQDRGE